MHLLTAEKARVYGIIFLSASCRKGLTPILRVLKLTAILLTAACLQVAAGTSGQTVTLNLKDAPVQQVFKEVSRQTGVSIVYAESLFKDVKPVTIKVKDATLQEVLDKCLNGQPFEYSLKGNSIVIRLNPNDELQTGEIKKENLPPPPLRIKVVDSTGQAIQGATVSLKNKTLGVTDANGEFTVNVSVGDLLAITFIGFEKQSFFVKNTNSSLTITLKRSESKLDDVQIIAYGSITRRLNTGNVSTVKSEEISKQPVSNPLQALGGRVPGLFLEGSGGMPGANQQIQIRGVNSLAAGNDPLYIVDGVPFNSNSLDLISKVSNTNVVGGLSPFNSIVPSDIKSIEILKDAEATSIYGSRGANGVVLITTHKGVAGKTRMNINVYQGVSKVGHYMNMLKVEDYIALRKQAFANDGITPTSVNAPDLLVWDQQKNTDWQKELIGGTASIINAQLNVSGGDKNTQFLFSTGYRRDGTVFPSKDLGDQRINGRLSLQNKTANDRFGLSFNVSYVYDKNNLVDDPTPFLNLPPNYPVNDNTGGIFWRPDASLEPYSNLLVQFNTQSKTIIGNLDTRYRIFKGLQAKLNMGFTEADVKQIELIPTRAQNPAYTRTPISTFSQSNVSSWIIEPQLSYSAQSTAGTIDVLAGSTFQHRLSSGNAVYASGFASDAMMENVAAAGYTLYLENTHVKYRYESFFGRVKYNRDNKYLLSATYRRDGSSRFGPSRRYGNFGSGSIGWIFSQEKFIRKIFPFLSFGKLRASYGISGNDQIPDYQYLSTYSPTSNIYQVPGVRVTRIANADYSWETNKKFELALEGGLFYDRVTFSLAWYKNRSGSQLVNYPLASQSGFASYQANLPALVENSGWEIQVQGDVIKKRRFNWNSSFNLTLSRSKLISFPGIQMTSYNNTFIVGQPLNLIMAYKYMGIDPLTGEVKVVDKDGNNAINNPGDFYNSGTTLPKYYGGFLNSFRVGKLQLDIFLQFANKLAKRLNVMQQGTPGTMNNTSYNIYDNTWRSKDDVRRYPKASTSSQYYSVFNLTDFGRYEDASYLKIKSVNISFDLGSTFLKSKRSDVLTLYIQGLNLLTITKYEGLDPETGNLSLPNLRTVVVGMNVKL